MTKPETVAYATRDGRELLVDVFRPAGAAKASILLLHGGGWREGSREAVAPAAQALAGSGFVALAVQYRLLGQAPWPAQIQDVKSAIRWARRNSGFLGIAPGKIVLEGFSAGAHLALLAAGTAHIDAYSADDDRDQDGSVAAVVAFFPPIEFQIGASSGGDVVEASRLLEQTTSPEQARLASPINHVGAHFPPTCLLHGTADHVVSSRASLRMYERLTESGVTADLHFYARHTHAFSSLPSMVPGVQGIAASFVERHVVDPAFYVQENLKLNRFAGGKRP